MVDVLIVCFPSIVSALTCRPFLLRLNSLTT
jgi:hypothetical protein